MFALNLKYLREKYHLQRRDIAALMGVNNGTVAVWEDGYGVPDREQLIRIADYFMVSERDLKRKDLRKMTEEQRAERIAALDFALNCIVNMDQKAHFSTLQDMYYELKEGLDENLRECSGGYLTSE